MSDTNEIKMESNDQTLNQFKVSVTPHRQVIENAVGAIITALNKADASRVAMEQAETNQLQTLKEALVGYPEPMTEEVWNRDYRTLVAEQLGASRVQGKPRYGSAASRDVMVNMIKVATMGLTLSQVDGRYAPGATARNLKKYANQVRPILQKDVDPATGCPRLRSIAAQTKPQGKLPEGAYYWLVGCENAEQGLSGANAVLGGSYNLTELQKVAASTQAQFKSFYYCVAKMEVMKLDEVNAPVALPIQNSAVFGASFSPSQQSVM